MFEIDESKIDAQWIAGIDEVGRGPLAGPVVSACVIMPRGKWIDGVNDSKKVSAKKRKELNLLIRKEAIAIGIGMVPEQMIDKLNIKQATRFAMKRALLNLKSKDDVSMSPDLILVDAEQIDTCIPQEAIIKGDEKSYSIACASIIAKEYRDTLMILYDACYPMYDFIHNKGYGTKKHREALLEYGPCELHRKSFIKKVLYGKRSG